MPKAKISQNDRYRVLRAICDVEASEIRVSDVLPKSGVSSEVFHDVLSDYDGSRYIDQGIVHVTPDLFDAYRAAQQEQNVHDWYVKEHPMADIAPTSMAATFADMEDWIRSGNIAEYSKITGIENNVERQFVLERVAQLSGTTLEDIYYKWYWNIDQKTRSQAAASKRASVQASGLDSGQAKWQQLQLGNDCLVRQYDKGTMFRLPPGSGEYSGYVFFHPNNLVRDGTRIVDLQSDGRERCKNLLYKSDYVFTLKNNGKEVQLTGEQLKASLEHAASVPQYQNGKEYLENCPPELRSARKFICLRLTWDESKGKFAKMPINPHTGKAAQVNNPETWGSFEEATAAIDRYGIKGGIGYILTGDDNIVGIDLDLDKNTHELTESGKKILEQMKGKTYIEYSASGALHVFGFGEKPGTWTRGAEDSSLEMYGGSKEGNRSLMLTGKVFEGKAVPMANIQEDVNKIYKRYFERPEAAKTVATTSRRETSLDEEKIIQKLKSAANAPKFERLMAGNTSDYGGDYSKADLGLCSLIAYYTSDERIIDGIYRQSGLYSAQKLNTATGRMESRAEKWDSQRQTGTYGQETIRAALAGLTKTYTPSQTTFEETAHLMVYKQTDKAVLVKVAKPETPALKTPLWLPKSRVQLDREGRSVVAADKRLIEEHNLPRFVPKPKLTK